MESAALKLVIASVVLALKNSNILAPKKMGVTNHWQLQNC
jgi:hypothetical protein